MNPTASFFIKLSIVLGLSLHVCANEVFGSSGALGNIEDELHALRQSRGQLRRRQTAELAPKTEAAPTNPTKTDDAAAKGDASKETGSKNHKGSKEEELAGKMFETIIQMGGGLELVTSLGSSDKEIVEHSKKVQELVPKLNSFAKDLMSAVPQKSDALEKSFGSASEAGEALTKALKAIDEKPEDANVIKENFKSLEKSFHTMLSAADNVAIAAIPKLAQLLKNEEQKNASPQSTGGDKAGAPAEQATKTEELKASNPKATEANGTEPKTAESKEAERKGTEQKGPEPQGGEPKGAEPKGAEPKAIEPIVPDVAVPQQ